MDTPDRTSVPQEVLKKLQLEQVNMTYLLKELVRMETPSTDPASQKQIRTRLKQEFETLGYRVSLIPSRHSGGHQQ